MCTPGSIMQACAFRNEKSQFLKCCSWDSRKNCSLNCGTAALPARADSFTPLSSTALGKCYAGE